MSSIANFINSIPPHIALGFILGWVFGSVRSLTKRVEAIEKERS